MASQEDLLKNITNDIDDSGQEEEKRVDENIQPIESEPEMPVIEPEIEPEAEISEQEYEPETGVSEPESELSVFETELEEEPELSDMEETGQSDTEDEISDIDELLASMDRDISDMEDKNWNEDNETLNSEVSQEDLISDLGDFSGLAEQESEAESVISDQVPDLNDVMEMSEDDIAELLSNGFIEEDPEDVVEDGDSSDQDVLAMLEGTDDNDLQDIQDMLQKSDNNEAVDDEVMKLLQEIPDKAELEEKILSEDGNPEGAGSDELEDLTDPKKLKALEKKRLKEEKAAARKAAKEAKKAEKAAKKRAKKAKKKRKNKDVLDIPLENANGEELLIDIDELDALVSKAGKIGNEEPEAEEEEASGDAGEEDFGVDLNNLFGDENSGDDAPAEDTEGQNNSDDPEAEDKKKEKREKKERAQKTGFLAKILSFLMEEDDEEDLKKENIRLSEENKGILNELDNQTKTVKGGMGGAGVKKDKKKDSKKDKKAKPKKEAKPKKAPKPKAEKPPKEPEPYVPPKKRLTPKKVLPVVLLGITVAAALLIFVNVSTDYVDKDTAKKAYYEGDYATCYQNLVGKELNETEAVMYGRSESILYIRLWYREYEMFVEQGEDVEALDSLFQTVKNYPNLYEYASKWNAEADVYAVYAEILNILLNKYGITELQAKEIAKERDDLEYTRMVVALAEGRPYGSWNQTETPDEEVSLPHELPEESDLGQGNFVDNR